MGIVNVMQVNIDVEGEADNEEPSEESHKYRWVHMRAKYLRRLEINQMRHVIGR